MSASTSEIAAVASGSQAESPSAVRAEDKETEVAASAPRRGGRTRKPTSKAAGLDPTEVASTSVAAQQTATRTGRKRKADDTDAEQGKVSSELEANADRIHEEVNEVFEDGPGEGGDEEEEDDKQYCICRGKDDGTFMISCEQCQEWLVHRP